jgi:hypothetical protein
MFRQDHPKTDASVRQVPVPEFAFAVRSARRLTALSPEERERTIFANRRDGGPEPAQLPAHLPGVPGHGRPGGGITPRWNRRTGATVLARGIGVDAAAAHLGHTSKAITEGHYIEPERTIDFGPADVLEVALRPVDPDGTLLARPESEEEEESALDAVTSVTDDDVVA